jgi:peroxiredoxin/YHS domain-containing protein
MHTFSRIGLASLATMLALASPSAFAQQPATTAHPLTAITDHHTFSLADSKGKYLALHFLTKTDTPECTKFVQDFLRAAPTVAGVMHVFIKPDSEGEVKAWSAQFNDDAASIFLDPDGALAQDLNVPTGLSINGTTSTYPATIVFDMDGKELFRYEGKAHHDHLTFDDFKRQLEDRWRRPALADYNLPKGKPLAVEGYDLVSYQRSSKPEKGKPEFTSTYRGILYHFANADNRRLFAANPEQYLPTYGGWCASAMGAKGTKVEIDPTNFKVKDGRTHLFYKSLFADALKDWNKHEIEWEPAADANWKKLTKEDRTKPSK